MKAEGGTYALVLACTQATTVDVGRLGSIELVPGFYIYVGSAFGPGGIKARVERHWRTDKRLHWHIDYLTSALMPQSVWFLHSPSREEHRWACALATMDAFTAVPHFGASDCRCASHLFHVGAAPSARVFRRVGGHAVRCVAAPG